MYLLDTNIVSYWMRGHRPLLNRIKSHSPKDLSISTITLAEIYYGIEKSHGPYMRDERHTAPSNEAFDASLKSRNARWGVRDVADVEGAANAQGLQLHEIVEMPANYLSLVFLRN